MIEAGSPPPVVLQHRKPGAAVLVADGINCHLETQNAVQMAGANAELVHINDLKEGNRNLNEFEMFLLSGGFSYGDDVASGKILSIELTQYLADQMNDFVHLDDGLILGVCNGDQVLVRSGLLPFGTMGEMQTTLTHNNGGHFQNKWIHLKPEEESKCVFMQGNSGVITLPMAHGEGQFMTTPENMERIKQEKLGTFYYCDPMGNIAEPNSPYNPNGSMGGIAAITDPTGHILGIMPHPERFVRKSQYPNRHREPNIEPQGLQLFQNMVQYVSQSSNY